MSWPYALLRILSEHLYLIFVYVSFLLCFCRDWFCELTSQRVIMRRVLWIDLRKGLYEKSFVNWLEKGFISEEFLWTDLRKGLYEKSFCELTWERVYMRRTFVNWRERVYMRRVLWIDLRKGLHEKSFVNWLEKGFIWEEFLWIDLRKGLYEKSFVNWLEKAFIWEEFLWINLRKGLYEKSFEVCICLWRMLMVLRWLCDWEDVKIQY